MNPNIIRPSKIKEAAGISKSTAYRLTSEGKFPKPIKLTDKIVGWRASDIEEWLTKRAKAKPKAEQADQAEA